MVSFNVESLFTKVSKRVKKQEGKKQKNKKEAKKMMNTRTKLSYVLMFIIFQ